MVPDTGPDTHDAPLRVLVAGGGVAGLEALLALRDMAGRPGRRHAPFAPGRFVYRPLAVAEPFSPGSRASLSRSRRSRATPASASSAARWTRVDVGQRLVTTVDGEPLGLRRPARRDRRPGRAGGRARADLVAGAAIRPRFGGLLTRHRGGRTPGRSRSSSPPGRVAAARLRAGADDGAARPRAWASTTWR